MPMTSPTHVANYAVIAAIIALASCARSKSEDWVQGKWSADVVTSSEPGCGIEDFLAPVKSKIRLYEKRRGLQNPQRKEMTDPIDLETDDGALISIDNVLLGPSYHVILFSDAAARSAWKSYATVLDEALSQFGAKCGKATR